MELTELVFLMGGDSVVVVEVAHQIRPDQSRIASQTEFELVVQRGLADITPSDAIVESLEEIILIVRKLRYQLQPLSNTTERTCENSFSHSASFPSLSASGFKLSQTLSNSPFASRISSSGGAVSC